MAHRRSDWYSYELLRRTIPPTFYLPVLLPSEMYASQLFSCLQKCMRLTPSATFSPLLPPSIFYSTHPTSSAATAQLHILPPTSYALHPTFYMLNAAFRVPRPHNSLAPTSYVRELLLVLATYWLLPTYASCCSAAAESGDSTARRCSQQVDSTSSSTPVFV